MARAAPPRGITRWRPYLLPVASLLVFAILMVAISLTITNTLDADVLLALRRRASPWLTHVMVVITYLGTWPVVLVVALAYALITRGRANMDLAYLLGAAAGGGALSLLLKNLIQRPRPDPVAALVLAGGFSFPSGHALLSLVFYGTLVRILASHMQSRRCAFLLYLAGALLIVAIGFSRLYLGVHYLTDVLAGYAIGEAWLSALALLIRRHFRRDHPPTCASP
ncbi:MAG: phosphatase PAP2 family protein [Anaerolineae bacterium]